MISSKLYQERGSIIYLKPYYVLDNISSAIIDLDKRILYFYPPEKYYPWHFYKAKYCKCSKKFILYFQRYGLVKKIKIPKLGTGNVVQEYNIVYKFIKYPILGGQTFSRMKYQIVDDIKINLNDEKNWLFTYQDYSFLQMNSITKKNLELSELELRELPKS